MSYSCPRGGDSGDRSPVIPGDSPSPRGWGGDGDTPFKSSGETSGMGTIHISEIFGGKPPKFGDGDGARHCKSFKNTSGKGTAQNFGGYQMIFGESPKNPEIPMSIDWVQFFFSTL